MVKKRKRKPKRKVKRYAGRTEKEWETWGEKFGKRMEKRGKDFSEEMGALGKRLGWSRKPKGKRQEEVCRGWWFRTFGFIGPLIGSLFVIVCIAVGIGVLNFINLGFGSSFISQVTDFLFSNLGWFFAVFLFFGYTDYFSKRYPKTYWMVSPIAGSICTVIVIWIAVWLLNLINVYVNSTLIASLTNFLSVNLWGIFIAFLVLGYAVIVIKRFIMNSLRF